MLAGFFASGCGAPSTAVRAEPSPSRTFAITPVPVRLVEVSQAHFEAAMARLVMDVQLLSPQLVKQRLVLAAWAPDASAQRALLSGYERWCEQKGRRGDCLLLGGTFGPDERRSLALSLAFESGSVWSGASAAVQRMVDPLLLQATVATFMAAYMAMLLLPEPISKAVAVPLTVYLVSWLGWSTLRSIIGGWRQLTREAEVARTFAELSAAGERFGRIMGEQSARVFVMLVTAALGQTAGLVAKGPSLPGYAQAALLAETQGLRLGAVGQVSAVASSEGQLTLTVAAGAWAMSASEDLTAEKEPGRQSSTNPEKAIRSLKSRLREHRQKLSDYKSNPDAFDNQGMLKNAPTPEIRARIIESRIKHLEDEIKAFEKAIEDLESAK